MANMMPGTLKVDPNLDTNARVDPNAIQPLPSSGIGRAAAEVSATFAGLGDTIGQLADKAAVKEGAEAGAQAGLDPEFRTMHNNTLRGDAFDKAGLDVAETRIKQQLDNSFDTAYAQNSGNAIELNKALNGQQMAIIANAPPELRPKLELAAQGKRLAFSRQQVRQKIAEANSAAAGAFETELADQTKRIHQIAYSSGLDKTADDVLAGQVSLYADALKRRDPSGQLYVTPEKAADEVRKINQTVATARISGAFDRLPTLDAKLKFIEGLQQDYAAGKGIAGTYDLDEFDKVQKGLMADYRSAKTLQAAQIAGVKEDVTAVSKMAEKGFAPAPDQMASLKTRVQAAADPKLAQTLAVAEDTAQFVNVARRATPAELDQANDQLREKLNTEGATPTAVARLDLGVKLADNMRKEIKTDPLGWADRVGLVKVPPIDFSDPDKAQASIRARLATAETIGDFYGQPAKYLRPDEKQALATVMAKGGSQALAVATTVAATAGDRADKIMGELSDSAPVMAGLGALVAQSGGTPTPAAIDAFDALAARQDRTEKGGKPLPPTVLPKTPEIQQAVVDVAGTALSADPRNEAAAINAANLVYEMRAARAHLTAFDPDVYKQALSEVLGERSIDGVKYGGVVKQSRGWFAPTSDVVIPPNVRQDSWQDTIDALSPSVLDRAGIGQPVTTSGKAIDFDRFRNGTLVQIGNGQYMVSLGDPTKPGQEQWAAETKSTPGQPKPLVLDFNKISPVLSQIRPDLFLGGGR
ncbi:hypothetical protein [Hyphomicrobium sp. DY-1]|uniref:hypothetical protein n=1 Tax=Hyphomicrobium sp. DY-1 TaxID=3075650 RepID=UPI0039C4B527